MSENSNLIIYQKYMDLMYYTYDLLRKYPKHERFALVQETKVSLLECMKELMYALKKYNKYEKLKHLIDFEININVLKVHIRLSYKYKYITFQNYETWSTHVTEVGKLLGGLINSCQKR